MDFFTNLLMQGVEYLKGILGELQRQNKFDLTRQRLTQQSTVTLAPGEVRTFNSSFRTLSVLTLTNDTTGVFLSFEDNTARDTSVFQGFQFETPRADIFVSKFTLENSNAVDVTITFNLGFALVTDNRLNVANSLNAFITNTTANPVISSITSTIMTTPTAVTVGTSSVTILNTTTTRRRYTITAMPTNTDIVFFMPGPATVTNGTPLVPGASATLETNIGINGISNTAGQSVRILAESF